MLPLRSNWVLSKPTHHCNSDKAYLQVPKKQKTNFMYIYKHTITIKLDSSMSLIVLYQLLISKMKVQSPRDTCPLRSPCSSSMSTSRSVVPKHLNFDKRSTSNSAIIANITYNHAQYKAWPRRRGVTINISAAWLTKHFSRYVSYRLYAAVVTPLKR